MRRFHGRIRGCCPPGLKQALHLAAKASSQLNTRVQLNSTEQEWNLSCNLFVLLKRKTAGEARSLVCVDRGNGYEAWRILIGRFEPQAGTRRMKEVADLMALQNKRCKTASDTSLILLETDRRQRLIAEIGGNPPGDEMLANVLWMPMGPGTRSHASGKPDASSDVEFKLMKEAVMRHTTLVGATSGEGAGMPVAMDVSSIASVTDTA